MFDMVAFVALTYLLAAVPFGLVVSTLFGGEVDIRSAGSGNIGTTNVARVHGWRVAAPVLALDLAKGFVPVWLAGSMWPAEGLLWQGVVAVVAFVGHCFPIYLELRGGKGVATGAGAMLAVSAGPTALAAVVWVAILAGTGRSSVAGLSATLALVVLGAWLDPVALPVMLLLGAAIFATHTSNIRRLVAGEEGAVVRPVRWGRKRVLPPTAEQVLAQGPGGQQDHAPREWREAVVDPLEG